MPNCLVCDKLLRAENTLDLGSLPICNRFKKQPNNGGQLHPLCMSQCSLCGLIQLSKYPSIDDVRPRQPWIHYNEPSAHLDEAILQLQLLFPKEEKNRAAMGIGPFDAPLIDRVARYGFNSKQLDIDKYLPKAMGSYPYIETMQALLRSDVTKQMAHSQGQSNFVSCRYLLEHSHNPLQSLRALGHLLTPDGLLLVEIPDSTKFLSRADYSFVWEEHISYFTEDSFRACALRAGYEIVQFTRYFGVLEDALIFVLRVAKQPHNLAEIKLVQEKLNIFKQYKSNFSKTKHKYRNALNAITTQGKKVAILGAGHQSIMFINALNLSEFISYAFDDAVEKIGYLFPGTSVPIVSSEHLIKDESIDICLLGVGPHIEMKIKIKCEKFLNRGGQMFSIFSVKDSASFLSRYN